MHYMDELEQTLFCSSSGCASLIERLAQDVSCIQINYLLQYVV